MSTTTRYKQVFDGEVCDTATARIIGERTISHNELLGPGFEHLEQLCLTRAGSWFVMERNKPVPPEAALEADWRDRMFQVDAETAAELLKKWMH